VRKHYFFCAYSNTIRCAGPFLTKEEAAQYAFGVVDRVTVLDVGTRLPAYFTAKKKMELEQELAVMHKEATGNDLAVAPVNKFAPKKYH
jgi:hypothetical protein